MIDYQNITGNEIKRIVAGAADPLAQVEILHQLTEKPIVEIKRAAGIEPSREDLLEEEKKRKYG